VRPPRANLYRDAWAGELRAGDVDSTVRVAGWVHRRRDHGGLIFIDLRDRTGIVQLVFHPETAAHAHALAERLRPEHVVSAAGTIVRREEGNVNPKLETGEIELEVAEAETLAEADTPPFPVDEETPVDELLRLRHRVIDLRRAAMQRAMTIRHTVNRAIRDYLNAHDFLEMETPIMTRSTPEGARDFLVPSRLSPGDFYALPQSPQLFKQMLMMAGYERYYQIARCFRDEDLRADRQPEFTQLDMEMSFVEQEDVIETVEGMLARVYEATGFQVAPPPWPRMTAYEAMLRYGSDKPDVRFGLEITDLGEALAETEFRVFAGVLGGGGVVRGLNAGARELSRKDLDGLTEYVQRYGAGGLVWAFVEEGGAWRSPAAKALSDSEREEIARRLSAREGDVLFIVADKEPTAAAALGALRLELSRRFQLVPEGRHETLWVVDFPAFEWNEGEGRWDAVHHPFTTPTGDFSDPGSMRSLGYDIVLDGTEIGGGSIRIHRPEVQREVFKVLGISEEEAEERFGFLLDAMRYGAPPHGGLALGLDRIVALIAGHDSIRDVIAFPKTASGADPLTGAPAAVDPPQLAELGLRLKSP
jgi:aspartyl-tRNA synthetase